MKMVIALKSNMKTESFLHFPTSVLLHPLLTQICVAYVKTGFTLRAGIALNAFLIAKRAQSSMNALLAMLLWYLKVIKRRAVLLDATIAITVLV